MEEHRNLRPGRQKGNPEKQIVHRSSSVAPRSGKQKIRPNGKPGDPGKRLTVPSREEEHVACPTSQGSVAERRNSVVKTELPREQGTITNQRAQSHTATVSWWALAAWHSCGSEWG